jgi:hypothetical protein
MDSMSVATWIPVEIKLRAPSFGRKDAGGACVL